MSAKLFQEDILFLQRILAVSGYYNGTLNGKWSATVESAEEVFFQDYERLKNSMGSFDTRTELNIMSLIPAAQVKAREFMTAVTGQALTYRILSGSRTYAEQDMLFKKKPKVTNAKGGHSNHNFGIAWDIGIFENGKYYTGATKKSEVPGLEWGGDWKTFKDKPHYQLATGKKVRQLRELLEKGKPYS